MPEVGQTVSYHLESRMREIRLSGSEGGGAEINRPSLPPIPLSALRASELFSEQFLMGLVAHPVTHEKDAYL